MKQLLRDIEGHAGCIPSSSHSPGQRLQVMGLDEINYILQNRIDPNNSVCGC